MATPKIASSPPTIRFGVNTVAEEQHARNQGEHRKQQAEGCDAPMEQRAIRQNKFSPPRKTEIAATGPNC
jgi:hypothetical protein